MDTALIAFKNTCDNIVEAVYPVTLILAGIGLCLLFIQAIRQKERQKFKVLFAVMAYFLPFIGIGFYRASNRYLLLLIFPVVYLSGYLFSFLNRKNRRWGYLLAFLMIASFTLKHIRIDHGVVQLRTYLTSLQKENKGQNTLCFTLENSEIKRIAYYSQLPLKKLTPYDFSNVEETILLQVWQRYIYEYDVVYLANLLPTKRKLHPSQGFLKDRCDFRLDFEIPRGRRKRKTMQFFRLSGANDHVLIPATANSTIPVLDIPNNNVYRWNDVKITKEWFVTGLAADHVKEAGTEYQAKDLKTHWELFMASDNCSCLRTNAIDLSKPFDCYIEYYGDANATLDINLQMHRGNIYRDNTVAYLPLKGDHIKKSIKLSFYPALNPEKLTAFLVLRLLGKGHIHITRLAFEKKL